MYVCMHVTRTVYQKPNLHAHLRVVGMHGSFCWVATWCIGGVLPYPLFNSSNLNFLDF